mmetsp:Transcript_97707/g.173155  ORF Transcript_97707/g.173155 Transcript_97707/m.173155 type:complete len:143 (-) Transcript_97707:798-1226(-)
MLQRLVLQPKTLVALEIQKMRQALEVWALLAVQALAVPAPAQLPLALLLATPLTPLRLALLALAPLVVLPPALLPDQPLHSPRVPAQSPRVPARPRMASARLQQAPPVEAPSRLEEATTGGLAQVSTEEEPVAEAPAEAAPL